jgi:lysophospholipase L1-like esterase
VNQPTREARVVATVFILACLPSTLGLVWLAAVEARTYWLHLLALLSFAAAGCVLIRQLSRRRVRVHFFLTLSALVLVLATPEVLLRVVRFRYELGVEFGYPRSFQRFARDPDLFWTFPQDEPGVNSLGFRGPEIQAKPEGACRLLFLGDSIVAQGLAPVVVDTLAAGPSVEAISLAVPGYSSYQGRVLVEKHAAAIEPDIVVVFYGWNDHWLARGAIDSAKIIAPPSWKTRLLDTTYRRFRTLQVFSYLLVRATTLSSVRVPLDEYVKNLDWIGRRFERDGVPMVLVTAPTSHYRLGVPDHLVELGLAKDERSIVRLHRNYNRALRELATANRWPVLDLERMLESSEDLAELFTEDGIHLTAKGLDRVGGLIADSLDGLSCLRAPETGTSSPRGSTVPRVRRGGSTSRSPRSVGAIPRRSCRAA